LFHESQKQGQNKKKDHHPTWFSSPIFEFERGIEITIHADPFSPFPTHPLIQTIDNSSHPSSSTMETLKQTKS